MSKPVPAAAGSKDLLPEQAKWAAAARLLREALKLLDESNAPSELGAKLDSVIHGVEKAIHRSVQRS